MYFAIRTLLPLRLHHEHRQARAGRLRRNLLSLRRIPRKLTAGLDEQRPSRVTHGRVSRVVFLLASYS